METSSAATWTSGIAPTEGMWLRRLSEFIEPTPAELAALEEAKLTRRTFKRNELISLQGECVKEVYLLMHGWAGSSLEVGANRSQLANIYLPGDFAGLPDIALTRVAATLVALTDVTVDIIPLDRLAGLFAASAAPAASNTAPGRPGAT